MHISNKRNLLRPSLRDMLKYGASPQFSTGGTPTGDSFMTFDQATIDSNGAFLVSELERLDQTMNEPLVSLTWSRDIQLREDVTLADEFASWTLTNMAAPSGMPGASGKSWASRNMNQTTGPQLDLAKLSQPLHPWAMEVQYTIFELEAAAKLGRPIDSQKLEALKLKHQMDIDEQVYIGDTTYAVTGLLNNAAVTAANVAVGVQGSTLWVNKSPDEMLADVNTLLNRVWASSAYAVMPDELRLPPIQFSNLVSQKVSQAGNISVIEFLRQNSLSMATNGRPLNIQPIKWLIGQGAGATNRMMAYTNDKKRVRFPMVPLSKTPVQYESLYYKTTYFGRLGVVEWIYPETAGYADGI